MKKFYLSDSGCFDDLIEKRFSGRLVLNGELQFTLESRDSNVHRSFRHLRVRVWDRFRFRLGSWTKKITTYLKRTWVCENEIQLRMFRNFERERERKLKLCCTRCTHFVLRQKSLISIKVEVKVAPSYQLKLWSLI